MIVSIVSVKANGQTRYVAIHRGEFVLVSSQDNAFRFVEETDAERSCAEFPSSTRIKITLPDSSYVRRETVRWDDQNPKAIKLGALASSE